MNPDHLRHRAFVLLRQNPDAVYAYQLAAHCYVVIRNGSENNFASAEQAQHQFPNLQFITEV